MAAAVAEEEVYCSECYVGYGSHNDVAVHRSGAELIRKMRSMVWETRRRRCRRCDSRHYRVEEDCRPDVFETTERIETSLN